MFQKTNISLWRKLLLYILPFIIVFSNLGIFTTWPVRKYILYFIFISLVSFYLYKGVLSVSNGVNKLFWLSLLPTLYVILINQIDIGDDMIVFMVMDFGMVIIGAGIVLYESEAVINNIYRVYVISSALSCIYYLLFFDTTSIYDFALKHCQAANVLISLFILICNPKLFKKYIFIGLLVLHVYTILNLNSRSTFVSLVVSGGLYLYVLRDKIKQYFHKGKSLIVIFILVMLVAYFYSTIESIVISVLRLDMLDDVGVERYSADRIPMIQLGLKYFEDNLLFGIYGNGNISKFFYVECFFIEILVRFGIPAFILYMIWLSSIVSRIFRLGSDAILAKLCLCSLLSIAVFTQHAPMGPGTAYGFAWLIFGYYGYSIKKNIKQSKMYGKI